MTTYPIETPSSAQLARSIAVALVIASVVLVTAVLPAEFGIDPTGIGRALGLTQLHAASKDAGLVARPAPEASVARANASAAAAVATVMPPRDPKDPSRDVVGQPVKPMLANVVRPQPEAFATDTQQLILAPGKGAELKTHLEKGQTLQFRWATTGPVAFDLHGEPDGANGDYMSYAMAAERTGDAGEFVAPFTGIHGWYWLNRSDRAVMLDVSASGFHVKLQTPSRH